MITLFVLTALGAGKKMKEYAQNPFIMAILLMVIAWIFTQQEVVSFIKQLTA